ncbi:MAG: hypothetical protein J6W82_06675 [Bacteroidales bacterium]|nr:hypothetical protein [Bacteroidales bacterium]
MKYHNYSAPVAEPVSLQEEDCLLATSFSNGEPIDGPYGAGEVYYYDF